MHEPVSVQIDPAPPTDHEHERRLGTIFVAGNSRSGTTMLARMLGRHSLIFAFQELHFVEELWLPGAPPLEFDEAVDLADRLLHNQRAWYHTPYTRDAHQSTATAIVRGLPSPVPPTDVLAAVLAHETRAAGKQVAVEQTPRSVFFLQQLLDSIPGSRAVVLTRDPRDVLLSQKNWWRRRFQGTTGVPWRTTFRQWADYHPLTTSLLWRGGVRAGLRLRSDPRVAVVRFEDVVADPHAELERILQPLGLEVEPAKLRAPRISSSNAGDRDGVGVDPSVIGRWRQGLSPAEVWISQRVTAAESAELAYPAAQIATPWAGLMGQAALWPLKTILAVLLNRARTRSLVTSVSRRLRP